MKENLKAIIAEDNMLVSPHAHAESQLTGSTVANMVARAKELGRTHFAYTDLGHLSSCLKAYALCKPDKKSNIDYLKRELKFIPGIEIYFKDPKCSIISGTEADRCKYFTLSLYCQDQAAYQALVKIVSQESLPTIKVNEENVQLWSWTELEVISKFNVNIALSGIHCIAAKPMLAGQPLLGDKVLSKLKDLFKDRTYVAILCEPWSKVFSNVVEIFYQDGTKDSILASDTVSTDRARSIKAIDLVTNPGHTLIKSKNIGATHYEVNKYLKDVKLHKGFLPLPGGDATLKVNKFLKALATRYSLPILVTDYAYYSEKTDKIVQTMKMEGNNKLQPNLHMKTSEEIYSYLCKVLNLSQEEAVKIVEENNKWAALFNNFSLKYDWRLADVGSDPLKLVMEHIKNNGRMRWDDPIWVDRLKEEIQVIAKNPKKDLTAYFLPIHDVFKFYKENGQLVGPGRGSCGGSLLVYLLGITQINPFKYDLPFSRFFSLDRIMGNKLPDIDVDLESRTLLVGEDGKSGYLFKRYGDKVAQASTRTTMRLKSAITDTNRYFMGKVEPEIELLSKGLPAPPQGVSDLKFVFGFEDEEDHHVPGLIEQSKDLKKYSENRPKEWEIVSKAMGLTKAFSRHACAYLIADIPIKDIVPTKEGYVTQYEAKACEEAGLVKYDFLVIKQLKDIRVCLDLINKKNGETNVVGDFNHEGKKTYIWDLPEVLEVFKTVWDGSTQTCFQINTPGMAQVTSEILPKKMMDIANILALNRPGPIDFIDENTGLNMVQEYILRSRGGGNQDIPELANLMPETYGIIVFQEQLNKIARQLAGFSGEEAEKLRENMGKKKMDELIKMKPQFIEGASKNVSKEVSESIWERMVTFGRYGFSIIHAVEYAHITYACMFLRHYYPLEWWAAILTNADEKEITGKLWPYVKDLVASPDINLSTDTMVVDYQNNKIRAKFGVIRGIGDATIGPIVENRPYKDIEDFVNKRVAGPSLSRKLIHVGILDSLFPPTTSFLEKLKLFEDAVEKREFLNKVEETKKTGKKMRATQPKEGRLPEEYLNLHPLKEAAMKKATLPSLLVGLYDLGVKYSKVLAVFESKPSVLNAKDYKTPLISGERLERLDSIPGEGITEDVYVAATCYVISCEEFSYPKKNPTKKALKVVLDSDGHISEKVLWPDYNSGELIYPKEFKRGCIATVFFRKKIGRKDMSITDIVVEA